MKQRLGAKKTRAIEKLTGRKVASAWTRGGWTHFWAEVWFYDECVRKKCNRKAGWVRKRGLPTFPPMVNWKTGEIKVYKKPLPEPPRPDPRKGELYLAMMKIARKEEEL